MFSIDNDFMDEGVLSAKTKRYALTIDYYCNNGQTKSVKYASSADYDEAIAKLEESFVLVNDTFYLMSQIEIVYRNALTLEFTLAGGKKVKETYSSISDLEAVLELFDSTFLNLKNRKYYNGKRINVSNAAPATLTITYVFDGNERITKTYDSQADYDEAIEKLNGIGNGTGGGGGARTAAPKFTPAAGKVAEGTAVTISCDTAGATIHYTTDGTVPDLNSPVYTPGTEITVPEDGITIKACAVILGLATSRVSVAQYYTSDFQKPYYKGWWGNVDDPLTALTKADLKGLKNLEQAEATKADSPNPNIYTFPDSLYPNGGRIVWAYPAEFGEINYFTDGLGKHNITDSYTKQTLTIGDVPYFIYVLTDPIAPDAGDEYPVVFTQA